MIIPSNYSVNIAKLAGKQWDGGPRYAHWARMELGHTVSKEQAIAAIWTGVRYDTWFTGPDGKQWHAVQYGDNTQIAHCRRTKGSN